MTRATRRSGAAWARDEYVVAKLRKCPTTRHHHRNEPSFDSISASLIVFSCLARSAWGAACSHGPERWRGALLARNSGIVNGNAAPQLISRRFVACLPQSYGG